MIAVPLERPLGPGHCRPLGESSPASLLCAAGAAVSPLTGMGSEVWGDWVAWPSRLSSKPSFGVWHIVGF